jgi:hypothetical protein
VIEFEVSEVKQSSFVHFFLPFGHELLHRLAGSDEYPAFPFKIHTFL